MGTGFCTGHLFSEELPRACTRLPQWFAVFALRCGDERIVGLDVGASTGSWFSDADVREIRGVWGVSVWLSGARVSVCMYLPLVYPLHAHHRISQQGQQRSGTFFYLAELGGIESKAKLSLPLLPAVPPLADPLSGRDLLDSVWHLRRGDRMQGWGAEKGKRGPSFLCVSPW